MPTDLVKDAEAVEKKARLRSLRDLGDAAILLRDIAALASSKSFSRLEGIADASWVQYRTTKLAIAEPHGAHEVVVQRASRSRRRA